MDSKELIMYRGKIDAIDDRILKLLGDRFHLVNQIAESKKRSDVPIENKEREAEILDRILKQGKKLGLNGLLLQSIFLQIFTVSKKNQQSR